MGMNIEKLISISSGSFNQGQVSLAPDLLLAVGKLGEELEQLLNMKDGFYAFESALRIFSSQESEYSYSLAQWNSPDLWRNHYAGLADDCLFFAEDLFGGQFCIKGDAIYSFDPETGNMEAMSNSFESWAQEILSDYNVWTGYPLAFEWQRSFERLTHKQRLMPKTPFVCGGQFELDNLSPVNVIAGMRSRANLARQIVDLPEGAKIQFNIVE
jgi:hypothetical protein